MDSLQALSFATGPWEAPEHNLTAALNQTEDADVMLALLDLLSSSSDLVGTTAAHQSTVTPPSDLAIAGNHYIEASNSPPSLESPLHELLLLQYATNKQHSSEAFLLAQKAEPVTLPGGQHGVGVVEELLSAASPNCPFPSFVADEMKTAGLKRAAPASFDSDYLQRSCGKIQRLGSPAGVSADNKSTGANLLTAMGPFLGSEPLSSQDDLAFGNPLRRFQQPGTHGMKLEAADVDLEWCTVMESLGVVPPQGLPRTCSTSSSNDSAGRQLENQHTYQQSMILVDRDHPAQGPACTQPRLIACASAGLGGTDSEGNEGVEAEERGMSGAKNAEDSKSRVSLERERRHKIRDGIQELRKVIRGRGNSATVLQQAVAYIESLQGEVKSLRCALGQASPKPE